MLHFLLLLWWRRPWPPKIGDKAAWAPRIAQGMDTLLKHATEGLRAMPPKGACMDCSEADLKAAIEYMVSQAK